MKLPSRLSPFRRTVRRSWAAAFAILLTAAAINAYSQQSVKKPNILVIMGGDISWFNPSCYNRGMMGYQTPNIDRIAKEGALFNCWYGQQSCTDPLASWNDTAPKRAIIAFVDRVTKKVHRISSRQPNELRRLTTTARSGVSSLTIFEASSRSIASRRSHPTMLTGEKRNRLHLAQG
jgi:hypothetical protein